MTHFARNDRPMQEPSKTASILLVDDRPDKLLALEAILEGLHQNLVKVRSGDEALRQLLLQDLQHSHLEALLGWSVVVGNHDDGV